MSMTNETFSYSPEANLLVSVDGAEPVLYNGGDMAWILVAGVLVMIMSPGVGFLYSGLLRRKNALSMIFLSMAVYSVVTIQWYLYGYSLAFSATGNAFIGDFNAGAIVNVLGEASQGSSKIPALLYMFYQSMFAAITQVIGAGGAAERARILPVLVNCVLWGTIVYSPIAHWVWSPNGWLFNLGDLDFAGGGPVHISSGMLALAYSIVLGRRRGYGTAKLAYRPHSVSHIVLGTVLLWFGWFGFNGGSELAMNLRSVQASIVTNIAAATGGLTWCFLDAIRTRRYSAVSLCSGIVAGLVGITPAAGYVGAPASLAIGFLTAIACNYATLIKSALGFDDVVDGFALHAVGGFTGSVLTGLFADARESGWDGYTVVDGGWLNRNWVQLGYQLAGSVTIAAYSFTVSVVLLLIIDRIPGLKLRASEETEIVGVDEGELGEYGYDYLALHRDVDDPEEHAQWKSSQAVSPSSSSDNVHTVLEKAAPKQSSEGSAPAAEMV